MIHADTFNAFVDRTFSFLATDYKMTQDGVKISGNAFYDVRYQDSAKVISISLETIEDIFQVILFRLENGKLPDYDDKSRTIHLNQMTTDILPTVDKPEFAANNRFFQDIKPADKTEELILKSAKELRLCLRYYNTTLEMPTTHR
ncbi:MAG: hypothetical protein RIG68_25585 [Imperialibacter sp.]|uniref:hypothetical protein n=1 Tax=Imperialibacter sp. TaxID=2038411 RepID=UPI0032EDAD87